jgi:hypothetical protein
MIRASQKNQPQSQSIENFKGTSKVQWLEATKKTPKKIPVPFGAHYYKVDLNSSCQSLLHVYKVMLKGISSTIRAVGSSKIQNCRNRL